MTQTEFKVAFPKKDFIAYMCVFSVIETALIVMTIYSEYIVFDLVLSISFFLICIFVVLATFLFNVKVIESTIKVRTRLGRTYQFNCSDIEEVVCSKRNSVRYGPSYYMNLLTKSNELSMECTMTGFSKMAGYILEQLENGEIKQTVVSESCKKSLVQYKNGDIFKKKRRNK